MGLPDAYDQNTTFHYVSDTTFIDSGVDFNVSEEYNYPKNPDLPFVLGDVRFFPEGNKNCYSLKPAGGQNHLYLIRASFMYGNYDGKEDLPEFDLYLDVNFWTSVKFKSASDQVIKEILSFAESKTIHVCLVNKGKGNPFISGLELRPVNSSIYGTEFGRNVSLVLHKRWDIGYLNGTGRYKNDKFDRIWSTYSSNISWNSIKTSANIDVLQNGYHPPDEVIKTAASPKSVDDPLELSWTSEDPNALFYAYLYFAELEMLEEDDRREMAIFWNGYPVTENSFVPSSKYSMTFSNLRAFTGRNHLISIYKTADSTLPPILNAIEIYTAQSLNDFSTTTEDVYAIESIKSTYQVNKNWTGDPCSSRLFPWEGLGCNYNTQTSKYQITSLNLSSFGLQGPIALAFKNLSFLESLDLSNNDLQQNVPEFLADLKHLKFLNLKGNDLTGFIPISLMKKANAGVLSLRADDQNLCKSWSCQGKKKINMVVSIAVGTSVIVLFVVLVIIYIILRKRKKGANPRLILPSGKRRFTSSEVSSITNNFSKVIGKGGFGIVYLGSLEDGSRIAVKMINDSSLGKSKESSSSQGSKQFQVEAELLLTVHHRNLASFVGYCDDDCCMAIIYEYMANGNLLDYLSSENAQNLSWKKRLHIATDAAQGLEYLHHGCRPPIVHRDVKTANILSNDNLEAKIADFGLSKVFPEDDLSHVMTAVMGTPGYIDPQYYNTFSLNEKSDVYSFGVVLLELITGQRAIVRTEDEENISLVHFVEQVLEGGDLDNVVDPQLCREFTSESAWKFLEVAMSCFKERGSNRPTMNQIVAELNQCLEFELARGPQSHEQEAAKVITEEK